MEVNGFEQEKEWLADVYQELDNQLAQVQRNLEKYRQEMLDVRTALREERLHSSSPKRMLDAAQQITQLEHSGGYFGLQRRLLEGLQASLEVPYFGRLDFHENGLSAREKLYIGVRSVIDQKSGWPLVYDWRAPVSSMFYDYGLGEAEYEGPGGVYRGEIYLKRQYRIKNRELIYMFDNELKIDDEILQEVLAGRASAKMRNIVNTIQREQNRAIRNDKDPLLLVEGPAGSGKTSVALHRIAYLLYRQRAYLRSENVLIFSPSKIFSDYISHVLPELGEENVPTTTFKDYAEPCLDWQWEVESQFSCLERLFEKEGEKRQRQQQLIAFKSSADFQAVLDGLVRHIAAEMRRFFDISVLGRPVLSEQEQIKLFDENYSYLPINRRLKQIYKRFLYLLRPIKKQLVQECLTEVRSDPAYEDESWWAGAREAVRRVRSELDPILERVRANLQLSYADWYCRLWQDEALWRRVAGGIALPEHAVGSLGALKRGLVPFEDAAALLYLRGELEGYETRTNVLHVIVDEVQDYGPLQLAALRRAFPKAKFTFVGDALQSLSPFFWENDVICLQDAYAHLGLETVTLTKSYRSTVEIFQFCGAVLGGGPQAENVLRHGKKPILAEVEKEDGLEQVRHHIDDLRRNYNTVAVICPTLRECERLYSQLSGLYAQGDISFLNDERAPFQNGVVIVPVFLAKGLEFDAVVLPEVGETVYREEFQRRLLYVACSRALHELRLLYTGALSPLLRAVPQKLYSEE
ncbi:MAG TPA: AAA family ATPase [Firmicutes bacterium]|nr:AAA family ATPase [Bacillota bacterium]